MKTPMKSPKNLK